MRHLAAAQVQCEDAAIAIVWVPQLLNDVVLLVALQAWVLDGCTFLVIQSWSPSARGLRVAGEHTSF